MTPTWNKSLQQRGLAHGCVGLLAGAAGEMGILMIFSRGPLGVIRDYGDRPIAELAFLLPPLLAGLIAGIVNWLLKGRIGYLLIGIPLIPVAGLFTYVMYIAAARTLAQLVE